MYVKRRSKHDESGGMRFSLTFWRSSQATTGQWSAIMCRVRSGSSQEAEAEDERQGGYFDKTRKNDRNVPSAAVPRLSWFTRTKITLAANNASTPMRATALTPFMALRTSL